MYRIRKTGISLSMVHDLNSFTIKDIRGILILSFSLYARVCVHFDIYTNNKKTIELVETYIQSQGEQRDEGSLRVEDTEGKGNRKTKRNMERNC